jgi:hypothetical protein
MGGGETRREYVGIRFGMGRPSHGRSVRELASPRHNPPNVCLVSTAALQNNTMGCRTQLWGWGCELVRLWQEMRSKHPSSFTARDA